MENRQPSSFGEFLYAARAAKGMNVRQGARAIGIAHSRLLDFEAGVDQHTGRPCTPALATLFRIAAAYDLELADVLAKAGFPVPGLARTPDERELLEHFRALTRERQRHLLQQAQQMHDGP